MNIFQKYDIYPPIDDEVTIAEYQSKLVTIRSLEDPKLTSYHSNNGIIVSSLPIHDLYNERSPNLLLLKHKENGKKKKYHQQKLFKRFILMTIYILNLVLSYIAFYVPYTQMFFSSRKPVHPSEKYKSKEKKVHLVWHENILMLGVYNSNNLNIYLQEYNEWIFRSIRNQKMKNITCVKFRPNDKSCFAVSCSSGVFMWDLDAPNVGGRRYQLLRHKPGIDQFEWDRSGNRVFCVSKDDHRIVSWSKKITDKHGGFYWSKRFITRFNGSLNHIAVSLRNNMLSVGYKGRGGFRVWDHEDLSWTDKWKSSEPVKKLAWSPCGKFLIVLLKNECRLFIFQFDRKNKTTVVSTLDQEINLIEYDLEAIGQNRSKRIVHLGGRITDFEIDAKGERIAIIVDRSPYIALLRIDFSTFLSKNRVFPLGYMKRCDYFDSAFEEEVVGKKRVVPLKLKFWNAWDKGSLLGVLWNDKKITFLPLHYKGDKIT